MKDERMKETKLREAKPISSSRRDQKALAYEKTKAKECGILMSH
jgi:hypothetical protein